jgi:hypothetical protein
MELKQECIFYLDAAIESLEKMEGLVKVNRFKRAIAEEANLLYYISRTLNCMHRLQFNNEVSRVNPPEFPEKTRDHTSKQQCIILIDLALAHLNHARLLLVQEQFEEAENEVALILTGRILQCLVRLFDYTT